MITDVDRNVGRLLDALDELGVAEETLFVFLSDNGPTHAMRFNGGLRGRKGRVFEGSIRVMELHFEGIIDDLRQHLWNAKAKAERL